MDKETLRKVQLVQLEIAKDIVRVCEQYKIKVFLDSRAEMYCKEFNNTSILEDWLHASRLTGDYRLIFNKYNFNYVLLYKTEPLNIYVSNDKDYELVYSDEYFMLYKKVE